VKNVTIHDLTPTIVAWARRRRGLVLTIVACAVIASIEGVRRLSFDPDVLSLLPHDGRVIPAFRTYLARVGSLDQLYVVFTAPEDHSIDDYRPEIDAWVERLRSSPEIERVDTGTADRTRDFGWLADRRLLLLRGAALDEGLRRLQPEGIARAVGASRTLLTVPSADVTDMIRYDPLGLLALVRDSLGGTQRGLNLGVTEGGYVSADSRSRLIIARPRRPPFDTEFSRALDARLRQVRSEVAAPSTFEEDNDDEDRRPPMIVEFAGGHRVAVETEALVKRESIFNTVGSLALILPLLYLVYRSLWLVLVGSLPSGLSLLLVFGALGFAGARLSSAATGASAMLFGLGVDGVVLLYVAYLLHLANGDPGDPASGLTGPSVSMLLGMWTTAATFYGLTFVDFPSLQQLGRLIGHSMLICGVLTLILVPALLPRAARRPADAGAAHLRRSGDGGPQVPASRRPVLTMPRLAAWIVRRRIVLTAAAVVVTLALGAVSLQLRVNPTLDRLRSTTSAALLETKLASTFGLPTDVYVVLAEGDDLERLLETNERLTAALTSEAGALGVQAPTALLPSLSAQARTAAQVQQSVPSPGALLTSLDWARAASGFKPGAFDLFTERLDTILDSSQRLTYDGYRSHGLSDLIDRFVVRTDRQWTIVTYAFPEDAHQAQQLQDIVRRVDPGQTVTGLPLVNRELSQRFLPQFLKGLAIGTLMVVVLVVLAFRNWRLSLFALLPTVFGLVWTAGILALMRVELDLFAMFAVMTFLGIGVDYGIHLVHRFRERGNVERATAELAPVILVAGAITLLGYGTLINSSYPPLRSMGVVSAVSVLALAAASVLVLPALLAMGRRS
jgi:predicted RND superfamily exporter protein